MDNDIEGDGPFDDRGVPRTLAAAKSLTRDELMAVVRSVILDVEGLEDDELDGWEPGEDGTPAVESQLGVDVFNDITSHLSDTQITITGITDDKWSSIGGIADAIRTALGKLS
ncbi:hypothetical protein [Microbacterium sp. WCS2018Hpa-9]|uniref:hypothetical protein n=1 Tax=Microbacterium sp. WCS2018Hpa-9 TaxID=3073635 RepID=UPI00288BCEE8|nr:hypothetical protein [Microbacterium sp. WCS2018Hpa-9]